MRRAAFVIVLMVTAGCAQVKPWQRGDLAHRSMDPKAGDSACSETFNKHLLDVREGATGCSGTAGGGCGCN